MPTYEYKCTECDERFEIEQSIHDDALTSLAGDEHEHTLKKVFSPIGIAFKGSGFYKNDARGSKKSSTTASSTSPTSTSSDGASSSNGASDSSPSTGANKAPKPAATPSSAPAAKSSSKSSD